MSDPTTGKLVYGTSLRNHHEIAKHIGYYMAAFANFEGVLWMLYGRVLGIGELKAMHLLGTIQSFSLKLDAVQRYSQFVDYDETKRNAIKDILDSARLCNSFRNKLAHGEYLTDKERSYVALREYPTDPTKKQRDIPLDSEVISDEIAKIDRILVEIGHHFLSDIPMNRIEGMP